METAFSVAFAGKDNPPRQVPSRSSSASAPSNRQVPFRSISRAQRDRKTQAQEWHSQLIQMDEITTKMLSKQISFLTKEQEAMKQLVVKAIAETRILESFLQHLCKAQMQIADDLKIGLGFDDDSTGISCELAPSVAISSMQKSSSLMILKIENLGVTILQQVLERINEISMNLAEHHADLHLVGRSAIKALQESEIKVKTAWEKYFNDATISMNSSNKGPPQFGDTKAADPSTCYPARQLPARRSSFKVKSPLMTAPQEPQRGVARSRSNSSERSGFDAYREKSRTRTPERVPRRGVNRNNSLRAMANAADLTVATTDVWLSEWSYRSHVAEQATLWDAAAKRMRELFLSIQETEVTRRLQFSQDLYLIVKNQQKLAVNLEAAAALGLMEFWEGQNQISEEKREEKDDGEEEAKDHLASKLVSGSPRKLSTKEPVAVDSTALPLFAESGYVTLTTLVKRVVVSEGSKPVLSLIVVTIDGLLYFFDLPPGCKVPFDKSSSATETWQAFMKAAAEKGRKNSKVTEDADFGTAVAPPLPSLRLVLARCSVEMTGVDCMVKICVPHSHGEDLRIELTSTKLEIAFIDAFHACKFEDEDEALEDQKGASDTDSISDVSCSVNEEP